MFDGEEIDLEACYLRGSLRASNPRCKTVPKINEDCYERSPCPDHADGWPKEKQRIAKLDAEWEEELKRRNNALS